MKASGRRNADCALIAALATGMTIAAASKQAGVSEMTAYRRLNDPEFKRALEDAKREALERATSALGAASTAAVGALIGLLSSNAPTARLGAARAILELAPKWRESLDLEARLSALEERLAAGQPLRRVR